MLGLNRKDWLVLLPVFVLFAFTATFRLGAIGLIDPDEPFYALTAREMLVRGDWITPSIFGSPQFEKPALAYWVYAGLFRAFGVHEWAARLGPVAAGLLTLAATAVLAKALFGRTRTAFLSAAVLASSGLFLALSRILLTDMFLCLFTTASFASFALGWKRPESRPAAWRAFFVFMGLGFLTKGPLGVIVPLGPVLLFSAMRPGERIAASLPWKSGMALFSAVALPWYAAAASRNDWFLGHFFGHENVRRFFVAEHRSFNTPFFYPLVALLGFFPWSAGLAAALAGQILKFRGRASARASRLFLLTAAASVAFFFSCASSKLISYLLPVFPLMAVLTGDWFDRLEAVLRRRRAARSLQAAMVAGWAVLPAALVAGIAAYERTHALGLTGPVVAAGGLCVGPCLLAVFLFRTGRVRAAAAAAAGMTVVFGAAAFGWILPLTERFFTSRPAVADFRRDGLDPGRGTLLASKISVRGVSFYTGNPRMAVVTGNRRAFYTAHSIPMIGGVEDLDRMDASLFPVYGLLGPKEVGLLREWSGRRYAVDVLDANSQRAIIRLDRLVGPAGVP